MSAFFQPDLYVRIEQIEDGPAPLPLHSGFSTHRAYRLLGLHLPSETAEAYLMLANDRDEMWFISNRHIRIVGERPESALHLNLAQGSSQEDSISPPT